MRPAHSQTFHDSSNSLYADAAGANKGYWPRRRHRPPEFIPLSCYGKLQQPQPLKQK